MMAMENLELMHKRRPQHLGAETAKTLHHDEKSKVGLK